jgi:hypothetical protein
VNQLLSKAFLFPFVICINLIFFSGCEKKYDTVINSAGIVPFVSAATSSLTFINTDTINIGRPVRTPNDLLTINGIATIKVTHTEGKKEISSVKYSIVHDNSLNNLGTGFLNDEGILPDLTANDSIYSGYVQFQFERVLVGKLTLSLWSENRTGESSNTILLPLTIARLNHSPVISDLVIFPNDTINLSTAPIKNDTIYIFSDSIKVVDPDGQGDILSVIRLTPSGLRAYLKPIKLDDSIYTETVASSINGKPSPGAYLFRFFAIDKSFDTSNVILKTIVITNIGPIE